MVFKALSAHNAAEQPGSSFTMIHHKVMRRTALGFAVAAAVAAFAAPALPQTATAPAAAAPCAIADEHARFELPLTHTARRIAAGLPVTIVAIGSSSTSGSGATSDRATYPSQLAAYLSDEFPDHPFVVHNRGIGGDIATGMLARFDRDVFALKPDLVLWQAGTNSLLRDDPLAPHFSMLEGGMSRLKQAGIDVVLIDPQYAPRVIAKPLAKDMIAQMARAAKAKAVNVFHRFGVMRHWREVLGIPFETFLSPDELHMNDWSYACVARGLSGAIAEAATRPITTAGAKTRR